MSSTHSQKHRLVQDYLKSSFTGDEDEIMQEYRHRHPDFPHQTTADQFFDEGQFEAYRALGQHIADQALKLSTNHETNKGQIAYADLSKWFEALEAYYKKKYTLKQPQPDPSRSTV